MKKIIVMLFVALCCSGCSLLPKINFNTPGTTPKSIEKSTHREVCQGELKIDKVTGITTCTKGYYNNQTSSEVKEREYTWKEKVINFLNGLVGWGFWIFVAACFIFPGLIGWVLGRIFNVFRTTVTKTVKAINTFKNNIPTTNINGVEVQDPVYVKAVDALLDQLEYQYKEDVGVMKTIANIRLQLKIEDSD